MMSNQLSTTITVSKNKRPPRRALPVPEHRGWQYFSIGYKCCDKLIRTITPHIGGWNVDASP